VTQPGAPAAGPGWSGSGPGSPGSGLGSPGSGLGSPGSGLGSPGSGLGSPGSGPGSPGPATLGGRTLELAAEAVELLAGRSQTAAVAESLTGGMLAAALTAIPGASVVFRGGIVAYATDVKASLLGVPPALLDARGAVDPEVAAAMAQGARSRLAATVGAGTTGVAGPDPADGQPVGTVHIAVAAGSGVAVRSLALTGDRHEIRAATVEQVLGLLVDVLRDDKS
jgi:nicotinamide-nucleotide amidase